MDSLFNGLAFQTRMRDRRKFVLWRTCNPLALSKVAFSWRSSSVASTSRKWSCRRAGKKIETQKLKLRNRNSETEGWLLPLLCVGEFDCMGNQKSFSLFRNQHSEQIEHKMPGARAPFITFICNSFFERFLAFSFLESVTTFFPLDDTPALQLSRCPSFFVARRSAHRYRQQPKE